MPQGVKDMLSAAGVLDAVPWDGTPPPEPSGFIQPDPTTFDWTDIDTDPSLPGNDDLASGDPSDAELDAYLQERVAKAREALESDEEMLEAFMAGDGWDAGDEEQEEGEEVVEQEEEFVPGVSHLDK